MRAFHCQECRQLVFFENTTCLGCERRLAYLPELETMAALEPAGDELWRLSGDSRHWRLCENYTRYDVCNWGMPYDIDDRLCASCCLTHTIPNLGVPGNQAAWVRLETAKRRLLFTLFDLELLQKQRPQDAQPCLAFEFLADQPDEGITVLSGHREGVITINVAEADDAERERRRTALGEPYRTLLGHLRHESGHFYWERLVQDRPEALAGFRDLFGDERRDYAQSLEAHYGRDPNGGWQEEFISAYAASHPWEDWAETWAHYLHMGDALETAEVAGLSMRPAGRGLPAASFRPASPPEHRGFEGMIAGWYPLVYLINNLNRGLGQPDAYPFVLSSAVIEKLRFVHQAIGGHSTGDHEANGGAAA